MASTDLKDIPLVTLQEMSINDVDSGIPRLTLTDFRNGETRVYGLAPDAVAALVDSLSGVALASSGQARVTVKVAVEDIVSLLRGIGQR